MSSVAAVVFDLDGVLVDTEPVWIAAKHDVVTRAGGRWTESASTDMLGMSGPEWAEYMRVELAIPLSAEEIRSRAIDGVLRRLAEGLPLMPDARPPMQRSQSRMPATGCARRWPPGWR